MPLQSKPSSKLSFNSELGQSNFYNPQHSSSVGMQSIAYKVKWNTIVIVLIYRPPGINNTNLSNILISGCLENAISDHQPIYIVKNFSKVIGRY